MPRIASPHFFFVSLAVILAVVAAPAAPSPMDHGAAVRLFDSWKAPVPPRHLVGNIYYVGAIGVSSFLITTPEGHILIDTGFADTVPVIERSVEQLGFKLSDIRYILSSHAHVDHVGGHASMKRLTGAKIVASAADAEVLASGGARDFLPLPRDLILYEPAPADRIITDGEQIRLGGTTLTANLTPGHTRGATTWTMEVVEGAKVHHIVFFSSASINPGTSLVEPYAYPGIVSDLEATFARFNKLPCDIFFAPHGGQFAMAEKFEKLAGGSDAPNPFIDPEGWKQRIVRDEKAFRDELARQRKSGAKAESSP